VILQRVAQCARALQNPFKGLTALMLLGCAGVLSGCNGSTPPQLNAIAVGPPDMSVAVGLTRQFTATGLYTDGSKRDITSLVAWNSANPAMASIDNMGLVIAAKPGATQITATQGSISGSTTLNVGAASLVSIGVSPANPTLAAGLTAPLFATGVYTDNSTHDLTAAVTWSSSAATVASVRNTPGSNGLVAAMSPGSATITATMSSVSGATTLNVTAASLKSIGITPANPSLPKGTTRAFKATGVYTDNSTHDLTSLVTWSTSGTTVASITNVPGSNSNGLATAMNPGSTTITADLNGVFGSTPLSVTPATLVSIGVTPPSTSIAKGLKSQFTATGTYSDNSTHNITTAVVWSSSDPTVATVSNASGYDGLGSALSTGSVTVTATLGTVSGSTSWTVTPAVLESIGVTPANPSIANGLTNQFIATGVYSDMTTQNLTATVAWSSTDTTIASISNASGSNGLASAQSQGAVTITAALGSVSGTAGLTVTPATLVSIGVTPANPSIADGTSVQFAATGTYSDNSTQDLTTSVTWSSSNTGVASISNASGSNGLASAQSQGAVTITAALGSVSGTAGLTVTPATLVSIGVTPANPSIANGLTSQFIATGTYTDNSTQNLTTSVTWSSSNTGVASISNASGSNGLASAQSQGAVTITAALGSVSGTAGLTVTPATLVSIGVTPANPSIADGTSLQFAATGTYTDNSTQNLTATVTWGSSDTSVAAISNASGSNGLASSIGQGAVTITATLGTVSGSTVLTVTPAALVSIAVIPANPSIANGTSLQFAATGTYTDNTTQDLTSSATWSSSNISVASISNASGSNGLASSASQGAVTITATLGTISGSTGLTVTPAALVSIAVIPANPSIANGTGLNFAATGTYTDNSTQPLTTAVTWSSSNTGVASISNASGSNGLASSVSQGAVTITATLGAISGSTSLTVTPAALVSIAVTPANPTIVDRTTEQFTATGTYTDNSIQNLTASVTWTSSATTVASISNASGSNGLATAVGVGSTSITAALGGVTSPSATLTATAATEYAYAANQSDNTVSQYTIGAAGALSGIGTAAAGVEPNAFGLDPSGLYLYVANWSDSTLSEYLIGAGGALTAIGTIATGSDPGSIAVDPAGPYVYVANYGSNTISEYSIGAGGTLSSIGTVATGSGPWSITADPTGHYVYVTNSGGNTVSQYTIGAGGALAATGTVATGDSPESIIIDPTGSYAYVANYGDDTLSQYTVGAGGALTEIGTVASGSAPESVIVDPSGHYVYAANYGGNTISEYAIGTGGALSAVGTVATGSGPWFITVDATGRYVYTANFSGNSVSMYTIGVGGALTSTGTVSTGDGPNAIITGY
jgi:trimeric autotransporter adhesin